MKSFRMWVLSIFASLMAHAACAEAQPILAQKLVNEGLAQNGGVAILLIHATQPGKTDAEDNKVIGGNIGLGVKSGEDDLSILKDGLSIVEKQENGIRVSVLLPLYDKAGKTVAALGMVMMWVPGQTDSETLRRAEAIRDAMTPQIESQAALFAPAH